MSLGLWEFFWGWGSTGSGSILAPHTNTIVPYLRTIQYPTIAWVPPPPPRFIEATTNTTVPYQRAVLYPALTQVIIVPTVETITVDKWFVPLNEPPKAKRYPSNQQDELFFIGSDTARDHRWLVSLSEPTRLKRIVDQPYLTWSGVTPQKLDWVEPLSDPTRRIPIREFPYLSWSGFTPVKIDWFEALSEPVRRVRLPEFPATSWSGFTPAISFDWYNPLASPTRIPRAVEFQSLAWSYFTPASTEVITVDKYFQWLAEPVRSRPGLPVYEQPYLYFIKADPFPETVSIDRWLQPLSVPTRIIGLPASEQSYLFFIGSDTARDNRWFVPLSEPTRSRQIQIVPVVYVPFGETVTLDKWFTELGQPVRVRKAAEFPPEFWSTFTPAITPPPPSTDVFMVGLFSAMSTHGHQGHINPKE